MTCSYGQWPDGANDGPKKPVYYCSCGMISSSPINHDHSKDRSSSGKKK
ncbi:hypothetical protein [Sphaerimonospora mesophila]